MSALQKSHHIRQGCIPKLLSAVLVLHTAFVGSGDLEGVVVAIDCQGEVSHSLSLVSMRQSTLRRLTWRGLLLIVCSATRALIWGLSSIPMIRRVVVHRGDMRSANVCSGFTKDHECLHRLEQSGENDYGCKWAFHRDFRVAVQHPYWGCVYE